MGKCFMICYGWTSFECRCGLIYLFWNLVCFRCFAFDTKKYNFCLRFLLDQHMYRYLLKHCSLLLHFEENTVNFVLLINKSKNTSRVILQVLGTFKFNAKNGMQFPIQFCLTRRFMKLTTNRNYLFRNKCSIMF